MKRSFNKLKSSLEQENKKIQDRFDKAEYFIKDDEKQKQIINSNDLVVREGLSLPIEEAKIIEEIKDRVSYSGFYPSKSEIIRAGIFTLSKNNKDEIQKILKSLKKIKKGRKTLND